MDPEADRLILEAAKRLLREMGYDRLTMDAVASRAGVARTTVYRRYRDKAELVSAAIDTLRDPAKRLTLANELLTIVEALDDTLVDPEGHRSGDPTGSNEAYDNTWYWRKD